MRVVKTVAITPARKSSRKPIRKTGLSAKVIREKLNASQERTSEWP
jgi:hypothetical protein